MNGARSLVRTLLKSGVETCFSNPGTSEMHFVAALDEEPGMRCVLGLQENTVTGMADGFYRVTGTPACTLLHCGPGLANGLSNLHNARRARSGVVNIVGDQATYHRPLDAPLTADTDSLARTVSAWVHTASTAGEVGVMAAAAVQAARTYPGQVATLILPSDTSWDAGGVVADPLNVPEAPAADPSIIQNVVRVLRSGEPVLLLVGGREAPADIQRLLWRIARHTGADVLADYVTARVERGQGRLPLARIPYGIDPARQRLAHYRHIVLVGTVPPVGFFAYPDKPSTKYPEQAQLYPLVRPGQAMAATLRQVVDALGAPEVALPPAGAVPEPVRGPATPEGVARTLAAVLPEGAIVADESVSYGRNFYADTYAAAPHDWLHAVGGAIGNGPPLATGAAFGANRQRRVVNLQADGSGLYTLQALWTQAREKLPVTTVIFNNGRYDILINEYRNVGAQMGPHASGMLELGNPGIDWVKLANGLGVEAACAPNLEGLADLLRSSFRQTAPFLIDLRV